MKKIIILLVLLAISQCLYENSQFVKTLHWSTFKQEVMQSNEAWFINFGRDNCSDCQKFVNNYEKAAQEQLGEVKYGYVDISKEKEIVQFFGINGLNHQIFLCEEKPGQAGSPSFFNWTKDVKSLLQFSKNEIHMRKRIPLMKGSDYMPKLFTKKELEQKVLASKDPWFLLFCSDQQQQECLDIVYDYDQVAKKLNKFVKFGLIDTFRSEITNVFGINGVGVCIFLGTDKPGPVGSPSLVGTQLKQKDYEKYVWDYLETKPTQQTQNLIQQFSQIPTLSYQQIMRSKVSTVVIMYTGSELFTSVQQLQELFEAFAPIASTDKITFGKISVDDEKHMVNHFDIWPVPNIVYFPYNTKTSETIIVYDGIYTTDEIRSWAETQQYDNQNDKQILLQRNNFETTVMNSQESWFIMFYTLNKNWCRKCVHLQPEWKKLSNMVQGKVNIGKYNCDNGRDICQKFEVFNFPKLVYMPAGKKNWSLSNYSIYEGAFSKDALYQFAIDNTNNEELSKLSHMTDYLVFEKYCMKFNGICLITVIDQSDKQGLQYYLNELQTASDQLIKDPVSFLYIIKGEQQELEKKFDLCPKGYPCVLGIDNRIDKEKGYKTWVRTFSSKNVVKNIKDILEEKRAMLPLKFNIPEIVNVQHLNQNQGQNHADL